MRQVLISLALVMLGCAGAAQGAQRRAVDDAAALFRAQHSSVFSFAPAGDTGFKRSAIDCAPSLAEPNWDTNSHLLGYTCYNSGN